jgi:hypothetical protein
MLCHPWAVSDSGWVIGLPIPRHELIDSLLRPAVDEACQQIREIGLRIDAIEFASLCRPPNYAELACFSQNWP